MMEKPNAKTILVVEDDSAIRRGLCDALRFSGYRVFDAPDGKAGLDQAITREVDLVLLDILMPKMDGMEVLRELRKASPSLPVIFLTAKGQEEDRVRGLRAGADDYVVKPFSASEVLARVEAVLRRSAERPRKVQTLEVGGCRVDFQRREAIRPDGQKVVLPDMEAQLLEYLAANPGRAVAREELLLRVWGLDPKGVQTRTVDMAVARLREHLGDDPDEPRVIVTVRGKGYMLATGQDTAHDAAPSAAARPGGGA
jgi:DNA-binding response OmpR family regulator